MEMIVGSLKDVENFTVELCKQLADLDIEQISSTLDIDKWPYYTFTYITCTLLKGGLHLSRFLNVVHQPIINK